MDSLEKYAEEFDKSYPDYADARYGEIIKLIEAYDKPGLSEFIEGEEFKKFVSLVRPVIAIKNYKSQIPFPEDLASVVRCVISIRSTRPSPKDILKNHRTCFNELMSLQGFQLPTVSAILHFCHPEYFPIVDINVKAACTLLKELYPGDFKNIKEPSLPAANTTHDNKAKKYLDFIAFICKVRELQNVYGGTYDFRYIDKALMMLGVPRLLKKVDGVDAH